MPFIARSYGHRVSYNFNLSTEEVAVRFVRKRLASLQQIRALGHDYVIGLQTSVVLIQGVSNDLCDENTSANDIFRLCLLPKDMENLLKRGCVTNTVYATSYLSSMLQGGYNMIQCLCG